MIRLRLVLYGVAWEGNVIKTIGEAFVYYHGAWVRISRRMFRRIMRKYRIVDSRRVDDYTVEFWLVREKTQGVEAFKPPPSGLEGFKA